MILTIAQIIKFVMSSAAEAELGALYITARKLLVAINTISSQQTHATEVTNKAVTTLLDYLATYPDNGILYRASDMILAAHSDAGFHNESKGRSRAGAHIFYPKISPSQDGTGRFSLLPKSSSL